LDRERFEQACAEVFGQARERKGIGTLSEKTLHAVLKRYLEPHSDNREVKIGNYVADIVGENGIIEIQTKNFTQLRPKLEVLLDYTDVTVVYPMAAVKYLSWVDPDTGEVTAPRKSPRSMRLCDCFYELIRIKYTLDNPHMHLKLIMLEVTDYRWLNGWSKDKKKGSVRHDRIPERLIDEIDICKPADYDIFIPDGLAERFTIKDFAKAAKVGYDAAQRALSVLCYLERVTLCGKEGRNNIYTV
jgi:hypothetical protein